MRIQSRRILVPWASDQILLKSAYQKHSCDGGTSTQLRHGRSEPQHLTYGRGWLDRNRKPVGDVGWIPL